MPRLFKGWEGKKFDPSGFEGWQRSRRNLSWEDFCDFPGNKDYSDWYNSEEVENVRVYEDNCFIVNLFTHHELTIANLQFVDKLEILEIRLFLWWYDETFFHGNSPLPFEKPVIQQSS